MEAIDLKITYPGTPDGMGNEEWRARVDLAAVYRLTDYYGWTSVVYNHITLRIPCLLYTSDAANE